MEKKEFVEWFADFEASYPSHMREILMTAQRQDVMRKWFETLSEFELHVAMAATGRMRNGKDTGPDLKELHTIPFAVARICRRLVESESDVPAPDAREAREQHRNLMERLDDDRDKYGWSAAEAYRRACAMYAEGKTKADVAKMLDKFCEPTPKTRQPRYRCLTCKDDGRVTCWHPHAMLLAKAGKLKAGGPGRYNTAVACTCSAGDKYATNKVGGREVNMPRYSPVEWLICDRRDAAEIEALEKFMAEHTERKLASRVTEWQFD